MKNFMGRTMAKMNDNRKKGRKALKGFTLVEIIVVLVILAILAAAMIPALTGYIDKAKENTAIAEARNVVTAAQTLASEEYALHGKDALTATDEAKKWFKLDTAKAILDLADVKYDSKITTLTEFPLSALTVSDRGKVSAITYKTTNGQSVAYVTNSDGTTEFKISTPKT